MLTALVSPRRITARQRGINEHVDSGHLPPRGVALGGRDPIWVTRQGELPPQVAQFVSTERCAQQTFDIGKRHAGTRTIGGIRAGAGDNG